MAEVTSKPTVVFAPGESITSGAKPYDLGTPQDNNGFDQWGFKDYPEGRMTELQYRQLKEQEAAAANRKKKEEKKEDPVRRMIYGTNPPRDTRAASVLAALGINEDLMRAIIAASQVRPTGR